MLPSRSVAGPSIPTVKPFSAVSGVAFQSSSSAAAQMAMLSIPAAIQTKRFSMLAPPTAALTVGPWEPSLADQARSPLPPLLPCDQLVAGIDQILRLLQG